MLGIVKEINGQKKIIPLTTDTGTGAPVGTLITQYKKVPMSGYLYCDGSTFDENVYPTLYMYLGTNVLPDYTSNVNEYTYIKATSGLAENQQENVLNDVKGYVDKSNSYSTQEVKTGGTWIDGKPIYRKTISCGALPDNATKIVAHGISNLGRVIKTEGYSAGSAASAGSFIPVPYVSGVFMAMYVDMTNLVFQTNGIYSAYSDTYVTIEYTKTTD